MDCWLTLEVFDGEFPANAWWSARGRELIEAAITNRSVEWEHHEHRWGVVLEVMFGDEQTVATFRGLPAVQAALDAVPDKSGLLIYRGRGSGAGTLAPHRPRPLAGVGD